MTYIVLYDINILTMDTIFYYAGMHTLIDVHINLVEDMQAQLHVQVSHLY